MADKEPWEHIAPELPPGWEVNFDPEFGHMPGAPGSNIVTHSGPDRQAETRGKAVGWCWEFFGITRRAYAELIAPQRVREAAEARCNHVGSLAHHWDESVGKHWFVVNGDTCGVGPDICTAAWAAISEMGGGE